MQQTEQGAQSISDMRFPVFTHTHYAGTWEVNVKTHHNNQRYLKSFFLPIHENVFQVPESNSYIIFHLQLSAHHSWDESKKQVAEATKCSV